MLRSAAISLGLVATLLVPALAENTPELAVIRATEALVRSGPGEKFYPTGQLRLGEQVEIYRRKENGWCAIRPPEDSFSYVRADHVRPTGVVNVVEVIKAGAKTRVGSTLDSAHQVEYITLKKGEQLQLVGRPTRLGSRRQTWYRVAPPSGEFRWIRDRDVQSVDVQSVNVVELASKDLTLPAATVPAPVPPSHEISVAKKAPPTKPQKSPQDIARKTPRQSPAAPAKSAVARSEVLSKGISLEKLKRPKGQMSTQPIQPLETKRTTRIALASHTEDLGDAPSESQDDPVSDAEASAPSAWTAVKTEPLRPEPTALTAPQKMQETPPTEEVNVSDLDVRLSELELALSRMVTQEVDRWNLRPLYQYAGRMAELAESVESRSGAQALLKKIEEFAALQRRHRQLAAPSDVERSRAISLASAIAQRPSRGNQVPPLAGLPPDPPNHFAARQAAIRRQAENVHYAGQGWLVPVISSRANLPRFALTDQQGAILAFVSPQPGLNLRRYLRRAVGIVGRETTRTDEEAPHLVAERVVVLERHNRY